MKNYIINNLINAGILDVTSHTLDSAHAYKVFRFKKAIDKAMKSIVEQDGALVAEAGIKDAKAFDARYKELSNGEPCDELKEMEAKYEKLAELRKNFWNDDTPIEPKTMPWDAYHQLADENKAVIGLDGKPHDVFTIFAGVLEGILWADPEEQKTKSK
jgi:hypothetical protein